MENITKALLIAAGVLIAIILLTTLVIGYNQISKYYQEQSDAKDLSQIIETAKKFINYEGRTIRGNEMLSVINLVADYNDWVENNSSEGYSKINFFIYMKDVTDFSDFHIIDDNEDASIGRLYLFPNKLNGKSITKSELEVFSSRINYLLNDNTNGLRSLYGNGKLIRSDSIITEKTLQVLSSNVHNIKSWLDSTSHTEAENKRFATLLNSILKSNLPADGSSSFPTNDLIKLEKIAAQYYEITQFKRAYFDCVTVKQNVSGSVTQMEFVVKTSNGKVEFN